MPLFQLYIEPTAEALPETLQFTAADLTSALAFANLRPASLPAELWQDGRRICHLAFCELTAAWVIQERGKGRANRRPSGMRSQPNPAATGVAAGKPWRVGVR